MTYLLVIIILVILSAIDSQTLVVPEGLSLLAILVALDVHCFGGTASVCATGLTAGVSCVWLLNQTRFIHLGGGDAKVFGMIGAWLGWQVALTTFGMSIAIYYTFFHSRKSIAFVPVITEAFVTVSMGVLICRIVKLFLPI